MNTLAVLLRDLNCAGVQVTRVGDRLRLEPAGKVTPTLRDAVLALRAELLAYLVEGKAEVLPAAPLGRPSPSASAEPWNAEVASQLLASAIAIKERYGYSQDADLRKRQIAAQVQADQAMDRRDIAEYRKAVAEVMVLFRPCSPWS